MFPLGLGADPVVGGGAVPPCLAHRSRSALSSRFSFSINFFLPFLIFYSRSIARSATMTGLDVNSQSIRSVCSFGILGTSAASAPSIPVLSCMTFIVMLNIAR